MLIAMLFSLLTPATSAAAQTESVNSKGISPEGMLNPDGTLNLEKGYSGSLDLSGYSVEIDPVRGPVFGAERSGEANPQAAVTPGDWAAVGDGGGVLNGSIWALAVNGTDVYVGGQFTNAANIGEADYVAKWDGTNWSALGGNGAGGGSLNSSINSIVVSGTDVYVGGNFSNVNNGGVLLSAAAYIAKWNGTDWSALGSNGAGGKSLNSAVSSLAVSGTDLYVGGQFTNVNNNGTVLTAADYIARWDGANWSALGSNGAGEGSISGAYIAALAVSGTDLYVGGYFLDVNNNGTVLTAADRVAKWDGANWSALGSNGSGNGSITSGTVYSLAASGSDVYVGGQFTDVNNNGTVLTSADWAVKWDGANWSALGSNGAGNGSLNNTAHSFFVMGTDVYVGGVFTNVNTNGTVLGAADYLAKWNGSSWSAIGSNGSGDGAILNNGGSFIMTIAMQGGNLLAGGGFYDLSNGGTVSPQADFLAQWDGANWSSLGTAANGALVNGYASSQVYAIFVDDTDVYVGGQFENVSNHGVNLIAGDYIAKWDGTNWSALGSDGAGDGSLSNEVKAMAKVGTDLYVGGTFTNVNNNGISLPEADYIAKWDGTNWSALGSNGAGNGSLSSSGFVYSLAVIGTDLYVGGNFTNVNNNGGLLLEADYVAKWDGTNWSALGNNGLLDGALGAFVSALAVSGSDLFVGGYFTNAASIAAADYIAKWDGSSWSALGNNGSGDGSLNKYVNAIAVNGTDVYSGGAFTNVNNNGTILNTADLIAKWDGTNWSALGGNGFGDGIFCIACGQSVRTIVVQGTDIFVGGPFKNISSNGVILSSADYVAKWDGSSWSALGSNGIGDGSIAPNSDVNELAIQGNNLLVGGRFSDVNNNGLVVNEADYLAAYGITSGGVDLTPPTVVSVTRLDPSPSSAATVRFFVTFSEIVGGLDLSDFFVTTSGVSDTQVIGWDGCSGATCAVVVDTGAGNGTIRLDVLDDDTIKDASNNPLGGVGLGNGDFTTGEVYTIADITPPQVEAIVRSYPNPINEVTIDYQVIFSEATTGVDINDFDLTISGISGAAVDDVAGTGKYYTVRVTTGTGSGTIRLNLIDNNTIFDVVSNPLGGAGSENGNFLNGESYNVRTTTFGDVPEDYWAWHFIERLSAAGITGGCGNGNYCPQNSVTRAQMAVFLLRGIHGPSYSPPVVGVSTSFNDVPTDYWSASWIKQLAAEGITGGCGNGNYCPETIVTRAQMAVFLLRAKYTSAYTPPSATGDFTDVPLDYWSAAWIEQLAAEGITGGCGAGLYCPDNNVTRDQMAIFLVRTFNLP